MEEKAVETVLGMRPETFAAVASAVVGVVLGVVLTPAVERMRRGRQVKALRGILREHYVASVGVIAQKRKSVQTMIAGFKVGDTPTGVDVPFPIEAVQRVDVALAEDLSVRERYFLTNVLALFAITDRAIAAGLSLTGNDLLPVRQAAVQQVVHSLRVLDMAEGLIVKYLQGELPDVAYMDETLKRFPK